MYYTYVLCIHTYIIIVYFLPAAAAAATEESFLRSSGREKDGQHLR